MKKGIRINNQLASQKPVANVRRPQGTVMGGSGLTMACQVASGNAERQSNNPDVSNAVRASSIQITFF